MRIKNREKKRTKYWRNEIKEPGKEEDQILEK
jgi:hypothetical protein